MEIHEKRRGEAQPGEAGRFCPDSISTYLCPARHRPGDGCRGIPIKVETYMLLRLAQKGTLGLADLATWADLLSQAPTTGAAIFNVAGGGGRGASRSIMDERWVGIASSHEGDWGKKKNTGGAGSGPRETLGWV